MYIKSQRQIFNSVLDQINEAHDRIMRQPYNERDQYTTIRLPNSELFVLRFNRNGSLETDVNDLPECCYGANLSKTEVYDAVVKEREYQDNK